MRCRMIGCNAIEALVASFYARGEYVGPFRSRIRGTFARLVHCANPRELCMLLEPV
jgi:hypothetical protein